MEQMHTDLLQQPAAVAEPAIVNATEKPSVPLRDRALAFALLALGYLVCRFQIHNRPLLGLVYGLLLFGLTLWHFRFQVGRRALWMGAAAILFLLSHLVTGNGPVRFFARWLAVLLWGYGVYCAGGNSAEARLGEMFVPEFFKANVLMPFSRPGTFFVTVFSGTKRSCLKTILFILLGLGLALVPLMLVVDLLRYDPAFEGLLGKLFSESLPEAVVRRLVYLAAAMILATLLMSAIFGSRTQALSRVLTGERVAAFRVRRRFVPLLVSGAMLLPLLLVYGLFFFSQWPLYTSAFTGVLPRGYTYADYAREGFFQLCAVCAINGGLYLLVSLFTRRGRGEGVRKALLTALCLCSLVLAATAFSKMVLYIRTYGLTPNRVYASWGMILLTGAFLLALAGTFCRRLNMPRALALLFAGMFGFLCLCDTNALIANYNVRAYAQGRLDTVDTDVFWELGDSAAPAAARLAEDPAYGENVRMFLSCHGERTFFDALCHGLPGLRARSICAPYWQDPADEIRVKIRLDLGEDIGLLIYRYDVNGVEGSGGASNADKTLLRRDSDDLEWSFERELLEAPAARADVRLRFSVVEEYADPNFDNIYPEELVIPMNELRFSADFGETYFVTITGDRENGYTAALSE